MGRKGKSRRLPIAFTQITSNTISDREQRKCQYTTLQFHYFHAEHIILTKRQKKFQVCWNLWYRPENC